YHNQRYGIEVDGQNATTIQDTIISSNVAIANGNTGIILGGSKVQDTLIVHNIAVGNTNGQITDLYSTRPIIAGNKENASDAAYIIKNDLVANSFQTSTGSVGATMSSTGARSFPGGMNIRGGISNDGTGLKHQAVAINSLDPRYSSLVTLKW